MRSILAGVLLVAVVGAGGTGTARAAPAAMDAGALRESVSPRVCCVTVLNAWGLPLAYANGFLLGQGRFVVTDLASVAQPGVDRVTLTFAGGSAGTAKEFGLADPVIGLAALRVEGEKTPSVGLDLAQSMPALDGTATVAAVGWRWCKEPDAVVGRLVRGPAIRDLAQRCGIQAPEATDVFLRLEGGRLDGAGGAAVVDRDGNVLAVKVDVAAREVTIALAVPAVSFRKTLLAAKPELKALTEIPKPLWPVRVLRMTGQPVTPAEFTKTLQSIKTALVCKTCGGKGTVEIDTGRFIFGRQEVTCPTCRGEKIAYRDGLYGLARQMAEEGARIVWAPSVDVKSQTAVRTGAAGILKILADAGNHLRVPFGIASLTDLRLAGLAFPHGVVVFGQVREVLDGPDGKYLVLVPYGTEVVLAVRADLLAEAPGAKAARGAATWSPGDQILLAGAAISRFKTETAEGFYVLPFDWVPAPVLPDAVPDLPPLPPRRPGR